MILIHVLKIMRLKKREEKTSLFEFGEVVVT